MRAAATLVILLMATACANSPEERDLASRTSAAVVKHQADIKAFVAAQVDLNKENASELDRFALATATARGATNHTLATWRLSKRQDLVDRQTLVSGVTAADVVAGMSNAPTQPLALTDGGAGAALDTLTTSLKKLSVPPGSQDQFNEIVEAFSAVNSALTTIKQSATPTAATTPAKGVTSAAKPKT